MNGNRPSFQDAVTRLNSRNLDTLLETSCFLSCIEFYGGMDSPLFPLLNNEKCRLFSDAIIASKAASYKSTVLTRDDLAYVLNGASEALNDPRFPQAVETQGSRDERLYAAQKFFARMANIQIRQQEIRSSSTVGRLLALLEILPQRDLDEFDSSLQNVVRQFAEGVPNVLGASLRDLSTIYMLLSLWHQRVSHVALKLFEKVRPPVIPGQTQSERQAWMIYRLCELLPGFRKYVSFSRESLYGLLGHTLPEAAFTAFVGLFARPIRDIREEALSPVYQIGPVGWRLSPLERYPVVNFDRNNANSPSGTFIIPNARTFMRSFADVIHFTLQERFGSTYNEVRGASQEVYIRQLVKGRLPSCTVIPEVKYRAPRGEKKGPDCTIVEPESGRLIVVEAKARRVLAETRFTMEEGVFDANFSQVYELFLRLPDKVRDLYARLPEYTLYQAEIDTTRENPPTCVAVVGESVYMMNEIIRYRARTETGHALQTFPWVYCVMSMESFELAVEIAASEGISLAQILEEFWDDGATMEPNSNMSDSFRGRSIKKGSSFAESFIGASDLLAAQELIQVAEPTPPPPSEST